MRAAIYDQYGDASVLEVREVADPPVGPDTVLGQGGHYVFVRPDRDNLRALADLVDSGAVKVSIAKTFTLDEIQEAHRFAETGHPRGKILVTI